MSDIKITELTKQVLKIFLDNSDMQLYGLQISNTLSRPYGSVLPLLIKLEKAGWLETDLENIDPSIEGRPKRKYYMITTKGKANARAAIEETQNFWSRKVNIAWK